MIDLSRIGFAGYFEAGSMPRAILDREYRFVQLNRQMLEMFDVTAEALLGQKILEAFPETDDRKEFFAANYAKAFAGESILLHHVYYSIQNPDAPEEPPLDRWWTIHISPLHDVDGRLDHILLVIDDRTSEVLAGQMKDAIAAELQHRIANLLTLVSVIARRTFGKIPGAEQASNRFTDRLVNLSRTNSLLSGSSFQGTTVRDLLDSQLESLTNGDDVNTTLDGPDIHLSSGSAQTISMAFHELATNAAKYGAFVVEGAKLSVTWKQLGARGFELEWVESGLTFDGPVEHTGFGSVLLSQIVPSQLQAEVERSFADGMHIYRITVPKLPEIQDRRIPIGKKTMAP